MSTETITFDLAGDFRAFHAAQDWCLENGVSYGSTQRDDPIGLMYDDVVISKWRNLSASERAQLDGTMTGDKRHGPVTITIKPREGGAP